ncbi:MAG: hypothetical protein DCC75_06030 [Proteobacteria bacterium]|nr:MAG: hypothetical protein DCC75_06030 [Pseudomonadota bacterium]
MLGEGQGAQLVELTREMAFPGEVVFDPEAVTLIGTYGDELSVHRAKKTWSETLQRSFLLDRGYDYEFQINSDLSYGSFKLTCQFKSACARYAFWRLTNEQAPEAQYIIETAHIPNSDTGQSELSGAGDLRSVLEHEFSKIESSYRRQRSVLNSIVKAVKRIVGNRPAK